MAKTVGVGAVAAVDVEVSGVERAGRLVSRLPYKNPLGRFGCGAKDGVGVRGRVQIDVAAPVLVVVRVVAIVVRVC